MEGVTAESSLSALSHRTPGGLRRTRQMESAAIDVVALWQFRARRLGAECHVGTSNFFASPSAAIPLLNSRNSFNRRGG